MVKRQTDEYKTRYPGVNLEQRAPSNYYPVDSAIMVDDEKQNLQFIVSNDRA